MNFKKVFAAAMAVMISGSMCVMPVNAADKYMTEVSAASVGVNDANLIIDFGSYKAMPGDSIVVSPTISNNGGQFAVSAIDVELDVDSPLKITAIGGTSAAFNGATVSCNLAQYKASLTPLTNNEPTVPVDGEILFKLKVQIPENCAYGTYNIGFGDKVEIFKGSQNSDKWTYGEIKGSITVGTPTTTTTTTTTTTAAAPVNKLTIIEQPENVSAEIGKYYSTSVIATGDGLTYQWYLKNPTAAKFAKSSITTSVYSTKMSEAMDGRQVYCVITDKYGNQVTTDIVTITSKVAITKQPENVSAEIGNWFSTDVAATGNGLTYQWYLKNPTAAKFAKSSITTSVYSTKMSEAMDGRQVYCVITDKYGNQVTTDIVTITSKVAITKQPENVSAEIGKYYSTSVIATGDGLTYQWYLKNPTAAKFAKSSITTSVYSTKMSEAMDGRQVYCVITDKYGNQATTDIVTITSKVAITKQPENVSAEIGKYYSTSVIATGDGLTYQWYLKNPTAAKFAKSSITTSVYSTKMSEAMDGRQVYCVITDKYGNQVTTETVTITKK